MGRNWKVEMDDTANKNRLKTPRAVIMCLQIIHISTTQPSLSGVIFLKKKKKKIGFNSDTMAARSIESLLIACGSNNSSVEFFSI